MTKWTIAVGDQEITVEASHGHVVINGVDLDPDRAEDVRGVLGTAIGVARSETP